MTDKDVLTQDEIDALLTGVDEGEVAIDAAESAEASVAEYDLTNQDRVVRGRLPTVELISERYSRTIRASLPASMKVPIEVGPGGVQVLKFSEYMETLYVPTCIKLLKISPFSGVCLLTIDAKLIHQIVDRFFGGDGLTTGFEGKEFSPTERRVIDRMVAGLLSDFEDAWEDVLPIRCEVIGDEVNPSLVNVVGSSDAVLVTSYRLDIGESGGELHFAFPYAALEPYKRVLDATSQKDGDGRDTAWRTALEKTLLDVQLPLNCLIGDSELKLREVIRMQPGDVVDVNMEELHLVRAGRLPIFTATMGDSRGRFALEFNDFGTERDI
ncbi:MAG: flagellar motor switch protein FliM [Pseudomonadales bacterium]|nr:flagellar motor switch protein FliM [Pseudomonadales bacterium]